MVRYMYIASLTNFNVNHDSPFSVVLTLWTGLSRNRGKISVTSEVFLFFNVRSARRVQHTHTHCLQSRLAALLAHRRTVASPFSPLRLQRT
jgi:hypothetical protein